MKQYITVFVLLFLCILSGTAEAAPLGLDIDAGLDCVGGVPTATTMFSSHTDTPSNSTSGSTNIDFCNSGGVFAKTFCMFETTLGMAIATLMCHLQEAWKVPLASVFTLVIVLTGVMFITGMLNMTVKELALLMFKIALVATFALNTPVMLNIAYGFFMGITKSSVGIVEDFFHSGSPSVFDSADDDLDNMVSGITRSSFPECGVLFGLILVFFITVVPFVFVGLMMMVLQLVMVFARGIAAYFFSLTMITLLLATLPIFLSFALFQTTKEIFDDSLKQLGQHGINVFVIFLFLAMAHQVDLGMIDFIHSLGNIVTVKPYTLFHITPWHAIEFDYCTICDPPLRPHSNDALRDIGVKELIPGVTCAGRPAMPWFGNDTEKGIFGHEDFMYFMMANVMTFAVIGAVMHKMVGGASKFATQLGGQRYAYNVMGGGRKVEAQKGDPLAGGKVSNLMQKGLGKGAAQTTFIGVGKGGRTYKAAATEMYKTMRYGENTMTSVQRKASQKLTQQAVDRQFRRRDEAVTQKAEIASYEKKLTELRSEGKANEDMINHIKKLKESAEKKAQDAERTAREYKYHQEKVVERKHRSGGIEDDILDPEIMDKKGQVRRASHIIGTHKDAKLERAQKKRESALWYMLLKD